MTNPRMNSEDVREVTGCETCGVAESQLCLTPGGEVYRRYGMPVNHAARVRAARSAASMRTDRPWRAT